MAETQTVPLDPATQNSPDAKVAAPRKRPYLVLGVLALALIVGAIIGIPYYRYAQNHEWTDDAFLESPVVTISPRVAGHVTTVAIHDNQIVKKGDLLVELDSRDIQIRIEQAQAMLNTIQMRKKSAQANTVLSKALTAAALLQAQSDVQVYSASVKSIESAVDMSRSQSERLAAAYHSALSEADEAKSAVLAVLAEHTRADAELKRYQRLDTKVISPLQMEAATAASQAAEAKLAEAQKKQVSAESRVAEAQAAQRMGEAGISQAEAQVVEAKAKVEEAKGRLTQAQAGPLQVAFVETQVDVTDAETTQAEAVLKQAQLDLTFTKIFAPSDGRVTRKMVEVGNYMQVGDAMMMLISTDVWVIANFRETQLTKMRIGQTVDIHIDAYPDRPLKGHVDSIQNGTGTRFSLLPPENATGNYVKVVQRVPVKIVFDEKPNGDVMLAPGMSVVPEVEIK